MSILIYFATIFWSLFPNLIHVFQGGDDFINKVNETNLVVNGDFSNGLTSFRAINVARDSLSIENDKLRITSLSSDGNLGFRFITNPLLANNVYYLSVTDFYTTSPQDTQLQLILNPLNTNPLFITNDKSIVFELTDNSVDEPLFYVYNPSALWQINQYFDISSINIYNVSQMKLNGVKNDNAVLFSDLTNEEIRLQLDTWIIEHGTLNFTITKDNTADKWFNTGFVEKTAERDFIDYLGYFFWLMTPPIILFITLDLIRRII